MSIQERLNNQEFIALLRAGHQRLRENIEVVNSLNIFPVPDGDTGTNMELSLFSGVSKLDDSAQTSLTAVTQVLTQGLLMGARGNSGVILSQLFRGFTKATHGVSDLDTVLFASALQEGVQIAYRAVAKPVEGTILTVAREAAAAGVREAKRTSNLADWMQVVYSTAKKALEKTPEQLPVLKQAGVVDSGGQGLVFIYEGFLRYLDNGLALEAWGEAQPLLLAAESNPQAGQHESAGQLHSAVDLDFAAAHIDRDGEYGYCTEVLVRVEPKDSDSAQNALRKTLGEYGDSLLVVGADDLVKVHVHTVHPGRVLEDALALGPLVKIKIDNMTEQHSTIRGRQHGAGSPEGENGLQAQPKDRAEPVGGAEQKERKSVALIVVAAGEGLKEVFLSLGADVVIEGGQSMNPSTEEIVAAVKHANSDFAIVLPNNKNIVMAAQQAVQVLGQEQVHVVQSTSIPQGIAAMVAYREGTAVEENIERMSEALAEVHSGQVVRAVRDSVFQDREIKANQYLGMVNQELVDVSDDRLKTAEAVIAAMYSDSSELLTVFYGAEVESDELENFTKSVTDQLGLEVEMHYGGQPVYDYIFSLE
ncbi:DAK2 domain-containing protein [Alicyclobacillus tolerans]|uniref:DAK2 domain-containing protein n=1 Tax=Alicyclobacillus tolerans TaxID=90970 RepID=UPI001F352552|nr:DAK2 domain-containing protein [Alicyclobacillus tolerans]MCF8564415.1 DAK2 domain-containing protein [Alicyclobacillus tolerans]